MSVVATEIHHIPGLLQAILSPVVIEFRLPWQLNEFPLFRDSVAVVCMIVKIFACLQ